MTTALRDLVGEHRPADSFLGEEIGASGDSRRVWVVDGIDGTSDFIKGGILWGTPIALVVDGRPVLGINTSIAKQHRWWADDTSGAWARSLESPRHVSSQLHVRDTVGERLNGCVALAAPHHAHWDAVQPLLAHVNPTPITKHPGIMVAAGEVDLALQLAGGPWDFAAIMPLVIAAGGRCLTLAATDTIRPAPPIIYTSPAAAPTISRLLRDR